MPISHALSPPSAQVPVPIFLPTTLAGVEQIIQTISELKDEVPSDACEADLLAMAHVIAEDQKPATGSGSPQLPVVLPCSEGAAVIVCYWVTISDC